MISTAALAPALHLLPGGTPSWDTWLEGAPRDIYHLAGYHRFAEGSGDGEPFLVVVGDQDRGLAWPYLLRPVPGSAATDVTSVYGYPGPVAWGVRATDPFLRLAWRGVVETWRSQGAISAFTRFHPVLGNAALAAAFDDPSGGGSGASLVLWGETVSIDCTLTDDVARAGYSKTLRQEIAAARRAGLSTSYDEGWTALHEFTRLYRDTMDRRGAETRYYLDDGDVLRLRRALGGHLHLLVTRSHDVVVAAGLFTEYDGLVQAHLVGTDERARALSPLKVLLDDARRWARSRGGTALHLGGGHGGREDTLFGFKKRFSARRHAFHTGRWVLDPRAYREASDAHSAIAGLSPNGYFPAYRAGAEGSEPAESPLG